MKRWFLSGMILVIGCGAPSGGNSNSTSNYGLDHMEQFSTAELLNKLNDPAAPVRDRASMILGNRGAEVLDDLVQALKHERGFVREGAAKAMGVMGEAVRPAVPALMEALCDEDRYVRREAGDTLLKLGVGNKEILTAIETLVSDVPSSRKWATEKLATYGAQAKPAVYSLTRLLKDENEEVRAAAAIALKRIDTESADSAGVQ